MSSNMHKIFLILLVAGLLVFLGFSQSPWVPSIGGGAGAAEILMPEPVCVGSST